MYETMDNGEARDIAGDSPQIQQYKYEGERNAHGERHGKGRAVLPNGDTYEGYYNNGIRHGKGKYTFNTQNKATYYGEYQYNQKNGRGTFRYPDDSKYEGQWKDDKRHGFGIYFYGNGDVYEGEWVNDQRHGRGTYKYAADMMVYEGMWKNSKRNGNLRCCFVILICSLSCKLWHHSLILLYYSLLRSNQRPAKSLKSEANIKLS